MKKNRNSLLYQLRFMLSLIWKASPKKIIWQSVIELLKAGESFVFSVIFIKYIVQILEGTGEYYQIILLSTITISIKILVAYLNSYYLIKLKPILDLNVTGLATLFWTNLLRTRNLFHQSSYPANFSVLNFLYSTGVR